MARLVKCGLGEWPGWSIGGEGCGQVDQVGVSDQVGQVGVRGVARLIKWG